MARLAPLDDEPPLTGLAPVPTRRTPLVVVGSWLQRQQWLA